MELNNIRLLVKDFDTCFKFYSEQLGLTVTWGKPGGSYASFDIGLPSNKMGFSIFHSDLMAKAVGNSEKPLPVNTREKMVIVLKVENVDKTYGELTARGVVFINQPTDMTGWGIRAAHFRDPEDNLIEIWSDLAKEKWDKDLREEADAYENK